MSNESSPDYLASCNYTISNLYKLSLILKDIEGHLLIENFVNIFFVTSLSVLLHNLLDFDIYIYIYIHSTNASYIFLKHLKPIFNQFIKFRQGDFRIVSKQCFDSTIYYSEKSHQLLSLVSLLTFWKRWHFSFKFENSESSKDPIYILQDSMR
jgi:hypothetical protein